MRPLKKLFTLSAIIVLQSCMSPANLQFESASTLKAGESEIHCMVSDYIYASEEVKKVGHTRVGYKIGIGFSDQYNLKIRHDFKYHNGLLHNKYLELDSKLKITENCAISFPVCFDVEMNKLMLLPRVYFTSIPGKNMDFTFVPKINYYEPKNSEEITYHAGFSMGMGYTPDGKDWIIRPEIGFDSHLSGGISLIKKLNVHFAK